jgi:hypothetical protein
MLSNSKLLSNYSQIFLYLLQMSFSKFAMGIESDPNKLEVNSNLNDKPVTSNTPPSSISHRHLLGQTKMCSSANLINALANYLFFFHLFFLNFLLVSTTTSNLDNHHQHHLSNLLSMPPKQCKWEKWPAMVILPCILPCPSSLSLAKQITTHAHAPLS